MSFTSILLWGVRRWILIPPRHDSLLRLESTETDEFALKTKLSTSEIDFFDVGPFLGLVASSKPQNGSLVTSGTATSTIVKSNSKSKQTTTCAESARQQDARRRRREERVREWARLPTIKLEQRVGEVLLVPSGWAYQFTHPPTPTRTRVTISQPSRESPLAQNATDGGHVGDNDIVNMGREADGDGDALALHVRLLTQGDHARVLHEVARTQPRVSPLKRLAPPDHLERLL